MNTDRTAPNLPNILRHLEQGIVPLGSGTGPPAPTTTTPSGTAAAELDQVAGEAGRILEAMRDPGSPAGPDTDELVSMVESARDLIAEAAETLRQVADQTNDHHRGSTLVARLEMLVDAGGWTSCKGETLGDWIEQLETGEEEF